MNPSPQQTTHFLDCDSRRLQVTMALTLLRDAWVGAQDAQLSEWQFAVEIDQFWAAGISNASLRWLLAQGLVRQATERQPSRKSSRVFRQSRCLAIDPRACFVLSSTGHQFATSWLARNSRIHIPGEARRSMLNACPPSPQWIGPSRQLIWQSLVVKHFRVPAANQEIVLAALQEEEWPFRIDDPLPVSTEVDPRVRLHDTIKSLNRNQLHPLLSFSGDGTGRGLTWRPTGAAS